MKGFMANDATRKRRLNLIPLLPKNQQLLPDCFDSTTSYCETRIFESALDFFEISI
jgi:hypothetical protein